MTHQSIKTLVMLRHVARRQVALRESNQAALQKVRIIKANAIVTDDRLTQAQAQIWIEDCVAYTVENKFGLIQIGKWFVHAAADCEKLPRGEWLRALNVNESEWFTPEMLEHGDRLHEVVVGLRLENSATPDTGDLSRPLACCFQMALYNAMKTDPVLAKEAHDQCNAMFGGRFGSWQEPTVLERLGVSV